ncbi:uncharacterized protein LOC101851190 [Aplysia californica]|uniref:Uncharacterized protein LOC101851190 n=1 Tax=Aplysia californica TaxID=6500 RepID=A0ABM0JQG5_APLCA|nr:uncharacterized protein LOC101851190 [Aplysia californica]
MAVGVQLFISAVSLAMVRGLSPYCTPAQNTIGKPLPNLSMKSFRTEIAGKNIIKKYSQYSRETFDQPSKRLAIYTQTPPDNEYTAITDGVEQRMIVIKNRECQVLSGAAIDAPFSANDGTSTFSTTSVLQLGGKTTYVGQTTVRGIKVDHWTKCAYISASNSTVTFDIYLSDPDWSMPSGLPIPTPVRYEMKGKTGSGTDLQDEHQVFDYINFELLDTKKYESDFEIPVGVYCPGVSATKSPPQMPRSVSYMSELKNIRISHVSLTKVLYDTDDQFSREDKLNLPDNTFYGDPKNAQSSSLTNVRDFAEGVKYEVREDGSCVSSVFNALVKAKGNDGLPYLDDESVSPQDGYVHMKTVQDFFHADGGHFNYDKAAEVRGIKSDMFTKNVNSTYGDDGVHSQVQLYFSANQTTQSTYGASHLVESQLLRRATMNQNLPMIEDIYDFIPNPQYSQNPFDIRSCFNDSQKLNFHMVLRGPNMSSSDVSVVGRVLSRKLAVMAQVSRARIHWDQVVYEDGLTNVMGTLMDRGPARDNYGPATGKMVDLSKVPISNQKQVVQLPTDDSTMASLSPDFCARVCNGQKYQTTVTKCDSFDFCPGKCLFYWGHNQGDVTKDYYLKPASGCNHYHKLVNVKPEPDLKKAWSLLRSAVFSNQVNITINGSDSGLNHTYTAFSVRDLSTELQGVTNVESPLHNYFILPNADISTGETRTANDEDECATACSNSLLPRCESFTYCNTKQKCLIREEKPKVQNSPAIDCKTYVRTYLAYFEKLPGKSVLSELAAKTFTTVTDSEECARKCKNEKSFWCESFDFCSDNGGTCALSKTHYYTTRPNSVKKSPTCTHYSRNYLFDYQKSPSPVQNPGNTTTALHDVSLSECAASCSRSHGACRTFYFCPDTKSCLISGPSDSAQVSGAQSGFCDVYNQNRGVSSASALSGTGRGGGGGSDGYSQASMAGLGVGMIVLGVLLAVLGLFLAAHLKIGRMGRADNSFSMEELKD